LCLIFHPDCCSQQTHSLVRTKTEQVSIITSYQHNNKHFFPFYKKEKNTDQRKKDKERQAERQKEQEKNFCLT
jgi:hypothetical protein